MSDPLIDLILLMCVVGAIGTWFAFFNGFVVLVCSLSNGWLGVCFITPFIIPQPTEKCPLKKGHFLCPMHMDMFRAQFKVFSPLL